MSSINNIDATLAPNESKQVDDENDDDDVNTLDSIDLTHDLIYKLTKQLNVVHTNSTDNNAIKPLKYVLLIGYDGSKYNGIQLQASKINGNSNTIEEYILIALIKCS